MSIEVGNEEYIIEVAAVNPIVEVKAVSTTVQVSPVSGEVDVSVVNPVVEVSVGSSDIDVEVIQPSVEVNVVGKQGKTGPEGPTTVSTDPYNVAQLGTDGLLYVAPDASSGVTVHGDLLLLEEDDHPQYLTPPRADLRYATLAQRIDFPAPLSIWVIDIGKPCHVIIYDSSKRVVEPGTIEATGTTELTLTFSAQFSGVAYCYT